MKTNPHDITRDFEAALCEYTGAKYAVAVTSCTMALLLAMRLHVIQMRGIPHQRGETPTLTIPKRTYVGVAMSVLHAGARLEFQDIEWRGAYRINPSSIVDSARRFTGGMYCPGDTQCVSFHATKILADTQGGAILHDDMEMDWWYRRARFDGRQEGVAPKDDVFGMLGWHCYLSPDVAARLLWKLNALSRTNEDLPNDDYPDLSQHPLFSDANVVHLGNPDLGVR
jgi:dTDP-4-amino-4,6-dideoxygalactose transaminase